jgi:uncharacterized membrane protein YbhN (UPF0104 family)
VSASQRGASRGHVLLLAAKILLSLGLLAFLFRRVSWSEFAATARDARVEWIVAAFLLLVASNVLGAFQWGRLLRVVDIRIPFWKLVAYYHVGLFFNNFLPANIGGDIARVSDASRYGPSKTAAFSAVLMDRLINTVALAGLAVLTTAPAIDRFHLGLLYAAIVGFFALSLGVLWAVFHPALLPACSRVLRRIGLGRVGPHLDDLARRLAAFRGQHGLFAGMFAVAIVVQLARIGVHVLMGRALGLDVPLTYFLLFVPLLAVIVSLPISLNGIGVREGAGIVLFGLVGVDRARAFSLQFMTYGVAVAVSLLGAAIFLARIPRRRAEARAQERGT